MGVLFSLIELDLYCVPFANLVNPETLVTVVRFIQEGSGFQKPAQSIES